MAKEGPTLVFLGWPSLVAILKSSCALFLQTNAASMLPWMATHGPRCAMSLRSGFQAADMKHNPYLKENERARVARAKLEREAARKREKERKERELKKPKGNDAFEVMKNSQAREVAKEASKKAAKKKKANKDPERSRQSQAGAAKRQANNQKRASQYEEQDDGLDDVDGVRGSFRSSTLKNYAKVLEHVKKEVGFHPQSHKRFGHWPIQGFRVDPSADPANFFRNPYMKRTEEDFLSPEDFVCPPVMLWAPELQFPDWYPDQRPMCPYHRSTQCVHHNGWTNYFRRCYDENSVTALIGREYLCKNNQEKGQPCVFYSYSGPVMALAPLHVQAQWRDYGFRITYRGAVRWKVIEQMKSQLAHGISANGFRDSIAERYSQSYGRQRAKWVSYSTLPRVLAVGQRKVQPLFAFDDRRSEMTVPSLNFLIKVVLEEMESRMPFYNKKMTMNGGQFLSGDHFMKIGKIILLNGEKPFTALYSVMNEFGQILLYRIVAGTNLEEIEDSLRGLNRRFKLNGFSGPTTFTSDRCCQERSFYEGSSNQQKTPIFDSFKSIEATPHDADAPRPKRQVLKSNKPAVMVGSSYDVGKQYANDIITECGKHGKVLSIDTEWALPSKNNGPDVVQITTMDNDFTTYIFQRNQAKGFPPGIKTIMESPDILKIASKIDADERKFREIGIDMQNTKSLQQLSKERGVMRNATAGLQAIFETLFPGIFFEKDQQARMSDWNSQKLDDRQLEYAHLDAYCQALCYAKLQAIPYVDPEQSEKPVAADLAIDAPLLLFSSNKNAVVAEARYSRVATRPNLFNQQLAIKNHVRVRVKKTDVRRLGAVVELEGKKSFEAIFADPDQEEIEVTWHLDNIRAKPAATAALELRVSTKEVDVAAPLPGPADFPDSEATPPEVIRGEDGVDEDVDIEQYFQQQEREVRSKCHHGYTKQDIEHVFIRFSRALSKKHGAFRPFMSRLSDAFFVPNQSDVDLIKDVLKKAGMSDDSIKAKEWSYYKSRIRRGVPEPDELERNFNRVVNCFANLEDADTGKPFFGPKAWNLYKATLRHVRKGCLSDIEDMTYYVQIDEDAFGIPIYKCLRGTSALEGFHQKVRQLLRGFNISPRFALALLAEFIHRWNHDVDVQVLGLSRRYANYYDGWDLEKEIELLANSDDFEGSIHPEIECTRDFVDTGEEFGIVAGKELPIEEEAGRIADAMIAGEWDIEEDQITAHDLTASEAWLSAKLKRQRQVRKVSTGTEKKFFRDHLASFQGTKATEANNFQHIRWSDFCEYWNRRIEDEDKGSRPKTDMTYKSVALLQDYHKLFKREGNASATLLPVDDANKQMRRELRGSTRETSVVFAKETTKLTIGPPTGGNKRARLVVDDPFADSQVHDKDASFPLPDNKADGGEPPMKRRAVVLPFAGSYPPEADSSIHLYQEQPVAAAPAIRKRKKRRCAKCGHTKDWKHYEERHRGVVARLKSATAAKVCQTKDFEKCPGFPPSDQSRVDLIPRCEYNGQGLPK